MYLKEPDAMPNTYRYSLNVNSYYGGDFREGFIGKMTFELALKDVRVSFFLAEKPLSPLIEEVTQDGCTWSSEDCSIDTCTPPVNPINDLLQNVRCDSCHRQITPTSHRRTGRLPPGGDSKLSVASHPSLQSRSLGLESPI